jgi:lysyl-tRNA synthetase class 2
MQAAANEHDFAPSASLAALQQRALLLHKLREFFDDRGFLAIETPLLASEVIPELYVEPIAAEGGRQWLQASPELHMKRLLAAGATAVYQVTRSFRAGERGRLHNPEFTIVEWYRAGDGMQAGMDLLDDLMQSLLGTPPAIRTTYQAAFQRHAGICPFVATIEELTDAVQANSSSDIDRADRDELLNLLLAVRVEPQLGCDRPEILYDYPASQASLARVVRTAEGRDVAERFELYFRGFELANGFHELTVATELRGRLEAVNAARTTAGRRVLPMPERLLAAMAHGLPPCTGCALGFDRLAMLAIGATSIDKVIAFPQDKV